MASFPAENLLEDYFTGVGIAYTAGAIGSCVSQFFKGFCISPNGNRLISGLRNARINAPITATSLGFWGGGVFPLFTIGVLALRQKKDPWNFILGATGTGMLYKSRCGLGLASKMGLRCAVAGSVFDCSLFLLEKVNGSLDQQISLGRKDLTVMQPILAHYTQWFGSLYGGLATEKLKALLLPGLWVDSIVSLKHPDTPDSLQNSGTEIIPIPPELEEDDPYHMYTLHFLSCMGLGCIMGTIGGYSYHFLKAFCNSANGFHNMHLNAPRASASFALWGGGILIAYEWVVRSLRQEDTMWKSTVSRNIQHFIFGPENKDEPSSLSITDTPDQPSATTFSNK